MKSQDAIRARSIEVIRENQSSWGSYPACPTFPTYQYSWMRDGSFIAYAMLLHGHVESAAQFVEWGANAIAERGQRIERIEAAAAEGAGPAAADVLPARYTLAGGESGDGWPNFQVDGYGAWLWLLGCIAKQEPTRRLSPAVETAAALTVRYLAAVWSAPGYDVWEEHGDGRHPSTLACVYGGLRAAEQIAPSVAEQAGGVSSRISQYLLANRLPDGSFPKSVGSDEVDGSLPWLAVPFGLVPPDDPAMTKTVQRIERELFNEGGVKRYRNDTYYGGGDWILLSCWLGWYYASVGRRGEAKSQLAWAAAQADSDGLLPEQSLQDVNDRAYVAEWERRWGPVANPLLWSHAMYLVLDAVLSSEESGGAPGSRSSGRSENVKKRSDR